MAKKNMPKRKRQQALMEKLTEDPFLTDEELAECFCVSVPTIRLDRLELRIPELRERVRSVAKNNYDQVKTLGSTEIVGELLDISLNKSGISVLETTKDMLFENTHVVQGQFIYAFAESLAIAIIDAQAALVGVANIKYYIPVKENEKLVAKAEVRRIIDRSFIVWVKIYLNNKTVFKSKFILVAIYDDKIEGAIHEE